MVGVSVMVEVGLGVAVGADFGASTLHAKIVSASITTTRKNGLIFENLMVAMFLSHYSLLVQPPNGKLYRRGRKWRENATG
jgi:hypothetical protein